MLILPLSMGLQLGMETMIEGKPGLFSAAVKIDFH